MTAKQLVLGRGQVRAFAQCAGIASEHGRVTARGPYADGYRAAARQISQQIEQLSEGRAPTPLERDLRDAEVEARTLARVVEEAERAYEETGRSSEARRALNALFERLFAPEDLPSTTFGEAAIDDGDDAANDATRDDEPGRRRRRSRDP